MIPQLQFHRVRVQIKLLLQIRLLIFPHIVINQGNRHDQGQLTPAVSVDDFQQLLLFVAAQLLLEISQQVIKDVGVFADRGL